ncbi:glycoside hydrolase family 5 protein [Arachidicoccus ginsenosidivorans]|uniref:glycoside hydrolase family 5 protein n=1 Tax=Arachidicoccus ginsenosidivorans TaxID=496057 RepID=UPI00131590CE|nr:glycoside hydrolase family 5 protein [Arachidicoccus ginsenosidivorans]
MIKGAIDNGIYVIVDWHSHNINLDPAGQFFSYIAQKYHGYPNIIYEVFNEPDEESWPDVKAYAEKIIGVIRQYDPKNVILVGCPHWDQDINLPAKDPIKGYQNLMYTLHFYAATHKQALRTRCEQAILQGLPVFISESAGMEASGNGKMDYAAWHKWINFADKHHLSWVVWSISDKDETCSMCYYSARPNCLTYASGFSDSSSEDASSHFCLMSGLVTKPDNFFSPSLRILIAALTSLSC